MRDNLESTFYYSLIGLLVAAQVAFAFVVGLALSAIELPRFAKRRILGN